MKFTPNESVLRVILFVFSIIFGMLSVSLICLGAVYIDELRWPRRYVGLDFLKLPTLLIILGSCSLIMSLVGCFCAKTYNRKVFVMFATSLALILCLELSIAIIAFRTFNEQKDGQRVRDIMIGQLVNNDERLDFKHIEDIVS